MEMDYFDSELIILEVQKHPCLYDMNGSDFKDRDMKREAWVSVTKAVVGDKWNEVVKERKEKHFSKEVQRRWKSMKDSYTKSLKKHSERSGWPSKYKKPYVFYKQLSFLRSVCEPKETTGNMNKSETSQVSVKEEVEVCEVSAGSSSSGSVHKVSRPLRKRKSQADTSEKDVMNVPKSNVEESKKIRSSDPDEMFFLSQIPLIKKMTSEQKVDFQVKFMKLLRTYFSPRISKFLDSSDSWTSDDSSDS